MIRVANIEGETSNTEDTESPREERKSWKSPATRSALPSAWPAAAAAAAAYRMHSDSAKKMTSPSTLLSPAMPSPGDAALVPTTAVVDAVAVAVAFAGPAVSEPLPMTVTASVRVQLTVLVVLRPDHDGAGGSSTVEMVVDVELAQLEVASTATAAVVDGARCCAHERAGVPARAAATKAEERISRGTGTGERDMQVVFWLLTLCKVDFGRLLSISDQEGSDLPSECRRAVKAGLTTSSKTSSNSRARGVE